LTHCSRVATIRSATEPLDATRRVVLAEIAAGKTISENTHGLEITQLPARPRGETIGSQPTAIDNPSFRFQRLAFSVLPLRRHSIPCRQAETIQLRI
jgi:hypothetical protein